MKRHRRISEVWLPGVDNSHKLEIAVAELRNLELQPDRDDGRRSEGFETHVQEQLVAVEAQRAKYEKHIKFARRTRHFMTICKDLRRIPSSPQRGVVTGDGEPEGGSRQALQWRSAQAV